MIRHHNIRLQHIAFLAFLGILLSTPSMAGLQSETGMFAPSVRFNFAGNVPTRMRAAMASAANRWNGCNAGNDDFPMFSMTSGATTMGVIWQNGNSRSMIGFHVNACALVVPSGNSAGQGDEIHFFRTAFVGPPGNENEEVDCFPTGGAFADYRADIATHEVAHSLGVDHAICSSPALGTPISTPGDFSSTATLYDNSRQLHSAECALADEMSSTPGETQNECPQGDPDCDQEWSPWSPIILDLAGDGFALTGLDEAVAFDIDADGIREFIGWVSNVPNMDAFLVLDRNENGIVDDGSELFGNATPLIRGGIAEHGFEALAEWDRIENGGNFDGAISAHDAVFERLWLWQDIDHDGWSDAGELIRLRKAGVLRIGTNFVETPDVDEHGNLLRFYGRAWMRRLGGRMFEIDTLDVFFVTVQPN